MDGVPTARTARGARTREAILDAAQELFLSPGYRHTSLREIAAGARLSHQGVLRHFRSKDEILLAVVERFEDDTARWAQAHAADAPGLGIAEIAERNAAQPGYLRTFTVLAGEATAPTHPAFGRMRERYATMRALSTTRIRLAQTATLVDAGRDPAHEATRLAAAWDGLQLLELYAPDLVSVPEHLRAHETVLARPPGGGAERAHRPAERAEVPRIMLAQPADALEGYAKGRDRRARIVQDASRLFAAAGYGDTSMRDIAGHAGVSKSTLFHHYPTKEHLLRAVLVARDELVDRTMGAVASRSAAELLRSFPDAAEANGREGPGLIGVYAVLSCEAVAADHPAHDYFEARFRRGVDVLTAVLAAAQHDGDLPAERDPRHEAIWFLALWDGLQIQWLYDPSAVDVAAELRAHLRDLLPA